MAKEHCECLQKVQHFAAKSGVCKIVIQYDEKKIFIKIKCRTRTRCQQVTRARKVRGTIETNGNGRKTINCTKNCTSHNGPAHTAIAHNCWKWNGAPHRYNDKNEIIMFEQSTRNFLAHRNTIVKLVKLFKLLSQCTQTNA